MQKKQEEYKCPVTGQADVADKTANFPVKQLSADSTQQRQRKF